MNHKERAYDYVVQQLHNLLEVEDKKSLLDSVQATISIDYSLTLSEANEIICTYLHLISNELEFQFKKFKILIQDLDSKVLELLQLSDNEFIFSEHYTHTNKMMWKIRNIYTNYAKEIIVLCGVDEGIETAIDCAIRVIREKKEKFYGKSN